MRFVDVTGATRSAMTKIRYFAYGSNLNAARMRVRVPSARPVAAGELPRYALSFHKRSIRDGSAKCNVQFTGQTADRVHGVLYDIAPEHRYLLDVEEGLGSGYEHRVELIETGPGLQPAFMYIAQEDYIESDLRPFNWYRDLVLSGARAHGLPEDYLRKIETVDVDQDADRRRAAYHLAYCDGAWGVLPSSMQ